MGLGLVLRVPSTYPTKRVSIFRRNFVMVYFGTDDGRVALPWRGPIRKASATRSAGRLTACSGILEHLGRAVELTATDQARTSHGLESSAA
jgi:hypothetical protein